MITLLALLTSATLAQPERAPFHDTLALAKQRIYEGDLDHAIALLSQLAQRVEAGEQPPVALAHEALVYLGDLQLLTGRKEDARKTFRTVLRSDPDYTISPYHHSEDTRALFALVREQVLREGLPRTEPDPALDPPTARRRLPIGHLGPFGLGQFQQGRRRAGWTLAGTQAGLALASIGGFVLSDQLNKAARNHPRRWPEDRIAPRVNTLRYAVQWPATVGFYTVWIAGAVDAERHWRAQGPPPPEARLGLGVSGVQLSGRW